ncbi:MAG: hypothetical protein KC547_02330 [Anaerolineae bacterium]|nr:hypothetical protein [Anaerolineae bacterium]MCA9908213.1 hypothetical protein [Anaerolineae bacterium]
MHDGFDQEIDLLISAELRNGPGFSSSSMKATRERLLVAASKQTMLPSTPTKTHQFKPIDSMFGLVKSWIYTLVYEETCYDRARSLPERTAASQYVWMHSFDRYMFMRPAF